MNNAVTDQTPAQWGPLCDCPAAPTRHRHAPDSPGSLFIEPHTALAHEGLDHCDECGWSRSEDAPR